MLFEKLANLKITLNESLGKSNNLVEIDDIIRQQVQKDLLQMYLEIEVVCNKYGIKLFLIGGTLLGAIRHNGFIPWDDDFDVAMYREDFDRFIMIFEKELGNKYILNAPNYSKKVKERFPKILKKNTMFREITDSKDPNLQGLFIDIFLIDNVPDNVLIRNLKGIVCNTMEFIAGQVKLVENLDFDIREFYKKAGKINYYIRIIIGRIFSFRSSTKWFNSIDKVVRWSDNKSKYCVLATGRKHYFGEMLLREVFFPASTVEFCGKHMFSVSDPNTYLRNLYGEYMKIPPIEKRERHFVKEIIL